MGQFLPIHLRPTNPAEPARIYQHSRIASAMLSTLYSEPTTHYFAVDSIFLGPPPWMQVWHWIRDRGNNISGATEKLSTERRPHLVHRLLPLPMPEELTNPWELRSLQITVRTLMHIHMRDGAVLYVLFLRRRNHDFKGLFHQFNLSYMPGVLYPLDGFWSDRYQPRTEVKSQAAQVLLGQLRTLIHENEWQKLLRLWYDPRTYNRSRRADAQWNTNRNFIHTLFGGACQGPRSNRCAHETDLRSGCVDHITPLTHSNHTLTNLQWLCDPCNKLKGKSDTHDEHIYRAWSQLPSDLANDDARVLLGDSSPKWLDRYIEPPVNIFQRIGL